MTKQLLFIFILGLGLTQQLKAETEPIGKYKLPLTLKFIDQNKDEVLSLEEARYIFDLYFADQTRVIKTDLIIDIEFLLIDLISYLEGKNYEEVKQNQAAKRFIELYYATKFVNYEESNFGLVPNKLIFGKDTVGNAASLTTEKKEEEEKEQTTLFDNYFSVGALVTAVYQNPIGYKKTDADSKTPFSWQKETLVVATIPINFTPWKGALFNATTEYAGGNGVGDGAGMAGYPNALLGYPQQYPYLLTALYNQEITLDTTEKKGLKGLEFKLGKFIIQDAFDGNAYSGDPRRDFLNFNHTMLSAWDAATTAYGFTYGGALKLRFKNSQINFAAVTVNKEGGGPDTDWEIKQGHSYNLQFAQKFNLGSKEGNIRCLGFYNKVFSGNYTNFITDSLTQESYFSDSLKSYAGKYGFGLDMDLALSEHAGLFARYSWNDGKTESMGYTQADQSINVGLTYSLGRFKRPNDLIGITASINDLSKGHRNYLANGGTGFMIGDGSLNYKSEMVGEIFFRTNIVKYVEVSFNYQYIMNAAYNKDRGNVHFLGWRLNFEF
ncbi:carbohydrate porin [Aurantibacillus circumpalustris]|uniref:carbohydrate porin n=1 Tax=Aurantibacillus circumpalustris TaxID=3036359 RepID=UPI00295B2FEE|nr:carbohydrate porin [Aurantibacillus circumpalustris]